MNPPLYFDMMSSPLGVLLLAHCGGYLCALDFHDYESRFRQALARRFGAVSLTQRAIPESIRAPLAAYLSGGDIEAVKEVPVHATGTRFQQQVWRVLRRIPAGKIWTYADVARLVGQPSAMHEVELAAARNPIAIIVPCHRVAGGDGTLAAYVGGLARKRWLLAHEGALDAGCDRNHILPLPSQAPARALPLSGF